MPKAIVGGIAERTGGVICIVAGCFEQLGTQLYLSGLAEVEAKHIAIAINHRRAVFGIVRAVGFLGRVGQAVGVYAAHTGVDEYVAVHIVGNGSLFELQGDVEALARGSE